MNIAIDAVGFDTAAEAFAMGNGVAAQFYTGMKDALSGYGQMAGDDKTSDEFAAQYDGAAADTLGAAADLVGALAGLARITSATGTNHRNANASSVYSDKPARLHRWAVRPAAGHDRLGRGVHPAQRRGRRRPRHTAVLGHAHRLPRGLDLARRRHRTAPAGRRILAAVRLDDAELGLLLPRPGHHPARDPALA